MHNKTEILLEESKALRSGHFISFKDASVSVVPDGSTSSD
jgi:hypothetical protein